MTERRAVMLVRFRERAHLTVPHQKDVNQLENQIIEMLDRFFTRGIAQGIFRPLRPEVVRHAIFGMCFMLTLRPRNMSGATVGEFARQLQDLACNGLLAR